MKSYIYFYRANDNSGHITTGLANSVGKIILQADFIRLLEDIRVKNNNPKLVIEDLRFLYDDQEG
jgi:hypothetical protein